MTSARTEFTYRYVKHERRSDYEAIGWIAHPEILENTHHGTYAVVMEWPHEEPERLPHG